MTTCRSCFFCVPSYKGTGCYFKHGTCYQANRKVLANMTACRLHEDRDARTARLRKIQKAASEQANEERNKNMAVKSNSKKRNQYRGKDGNSIPGVTIAEILDKPLTILAKCQYTWGLFDGLAVKVEGPNGKLAIVEITAEIPIKALCDPKLPKSPYKAKFVQKTSKNKRKYYTVEVLSEDERPVQDEGTDLPY